MNLKAPIIAMTLLVSLCCAIYFSNCSRKMEDAKIDDNGIKQIGENLYLKMLYVNNDHFYLLVDSNSNLVSTNVSSRFYVGKYKKAAIFIGPKNPEKLK